MSKIKKVKTTHHYFVSSFMNWACDVDLHKALNRLRRADGTDFDVIMYLVPGDVTAEYEMDNYRPQVKGAVFIGHMNLTKDVSKVLRDEK